MADRMLMKFLPMYPDDGAGAGGGGAGAAGAAGAGAGAAAGGAGAGAGAGAGSAGAAAGAGGGAAGGAGAAGGQGDKPAFGDNWRQAIAGDNADHLKTLERFASPKALYDSYAAMRQKMSSGELKQNVPFPEKGTPEEQALWRKEAGIPEAPDKYEIKLPDGIVLGDSEKPLVEAFLKRAHAKNMRPEHVNESLAAFYEERERRSEERRTKDIELAEKGSEELRSEWGADYTRNKNLVSGLLDGAPEGVKDMIANGRLADQTPIMSNPNVLRWLVDLARQVNPAGSVLPGVAGTNLGTAIGDEIAKIEKTMREDRPAYNRDTKMQARLRELYNARDQMAKGQKKAA